MLWLHLPVTRCLTPWSVRVRPASGLGMPRSLSALAIRLTPQPCSLPLQDLQPDGDLVRVFGHDPHVAARLPHGLARRQLLQDVAGGVHQDADEAVRRVAADAVAALGQFLLGTQHALGVLAQLLAALVVGQAAVPCRGGCSARRAESAASRRRNERP